MGAWLFLVRFRGGGLGFFGGGGGSTTFIFMGVGILHPLSNGVWNVIEPG